MKNVDWLYRRNSCTSCKRAEDFLESHKIAVENTVDCKKHPLKPDDLIERLSSVERVLITKGRKLLELDPSSDREEIVSIAIGRSGNLRAPSLQKGGLLIVGFWKRPTSKYRAFVYKFAKTGLTN